MGTPITEGFCARDVVCTRCGLVIARNMCTPENPSIAIEFDCPACGEKVIYPHLIFCFAPAPAARLPKMVSETRRASPGSAGLRF